MHFIPKINGQKNAYEFQILIYWTTFETLKLMEFP